MSYDIFEHQHRFAIWTAARAVQRSFISTKFIGEAIEATSLRKFSESEINISLEDYKQLHKEWSTQIITTLNNKVECSYGRAAKIIAIYLKTTVVIPEKGLTQRCEVIYPPIDRVLLKALSKLEELKDFDKEKWTTFDEPKYKEVANRIRKKFSCFNWSIEKYWNLNGEEKTLLEDHISDINDSDQIFFDGYCPESFLNGKMIEMKLNNNDFWESIETGLQIAISQPFATILKWRGKGDFRKSSKNCSSMHEGLVYCEPTSDKAHDFLPEETKLLLTQRLLNNYIKTLEKG